MSNIIYFPLRPGTPLYNRAVIAQLRKSALPKAVARGVAV